MACHIGLWIGEQCVPAPHPLVIHSQQLKRTDFFYIFKRIVRGGVVDSCAGIYKGKENSHVV